MTGEKGTQNTQAVCVNPLECILQPVLTTDLRGQNMTGESYMVEIYCIQSIHRSVMREREGAM